MILNNTQANIFKVNGGIADNFANRPAASGSFYIFYSIDTQEIYYDNGAWILIGSGGGGVNIYNSDGTLTGNRILNANNNNLDFQNIDNLNLFTTNANFGGQISIKFFDAGQQITSLSIFQNAISLNSFNILTNNFSDFNVTDTLIKSRFQGNDIGLKLDFANSVYQFGQLNGNNNTYLQIDDFNEILKTQSSGIIDGLNFDFANEIFEFGQINSANGVHIKINGSAGIDTLQTIYNNNEQGLELQLNNSIYRLGHLVGGNQTQINLDDTLQSIILESSINIPGEEIKLLINGGSSALVVTQFQQTDIGLKLDFANTIYKLGQLSGGNNTYLEIDDNLQVFRFYNNGVNNGLYLSFSNDVYFLGAISGTPFAGAQFRVNNNDPYPLQLEGTGIINASAGGASGQHLRIKINGTDYKIALLNP